MNNMVQWKIGDNTKIDRWKDNWIQPGYNLQHLRNDPDGIHKINKISNLLNDNGDWNVDYINVFFPVDTMADLISTNPQKDENGEDICIWRGNTSGNFTISNSYHIISSTNSMTIQETGNDLEVGGP